MANLTTTFAADWIPELWTDMAVEELTSKVVVTDIVNRDYEPLVISKGDVINIPVEGSFSVSTKTAGTALTPAVPATSGSVTLTIDQHSAVPLRVEDIAKIQASAGLMASYTRRMTTPIRNDIEDAVLSNLSASGTNDVTAISASKLTTTEILHAKELLDAADVPDEDRFMVLRTATYNNLLGNTTVTSRDFIGLGQPTVDGSLGNVFGFEVFKSSRLANNDTARDVFFHKDAVALVVQQGITFKSQESAMDLSLDLVAHVIYGTAKLDSNKIVTYRGGAS